jgi:two-component system chemotaxis response regulator CheB
MYDAIVIGVSAGGLNALSEVLVDLPENFPVPIMVVQHLGRQSEGYVATYLDDRSSVKVKFAELNEISEFLIKLF